MICTALFLKKLLLPISPSKIGPSLELNRKKALKINRPQKVYSQINIYLMKHWNNLCLKKELDSDQKRDYFMNKNQVLRIKKIF